MLIRDRHDRILQLINQNTRLSFSELTNILNISESTLRRDLNELNEKGLIKIVRGGAESVSALLGRGEERLDKRYNLYSQEKDRVARYAASLIKENDLVFIDSGSTTEKMCEYIKERNATYVTIGLKQALLLSNQGLNVCIAPGKIKQLIAALQGGHTLNFLTQFNFSIGFFGALGVSLNGGVSTPDGEDAVIKAAVIKRTRQIYILTDHSKIGVDTSVKFSDLRHINIITDRSNLDLSSYKHETNIIEV